MRSIERRFNISKNTTTITKFYDAIAYQKFSKDRIKRYFNQLVDKDDYDQSDKRAILQDLYRLTNKDNPRK
jgi:hypothetical protein